jgi:hypothetical protein
VHEGHSDSMKLVDDCRCVELLECDLGRAETNVNSG